MGLIKILKSNHFLSLISNAVIPALGMLVFSLLAHNYADKDQFGYWVFFQVVFTLTDTFRTGFLQTAMVKFYAGADDARKSSVIAATWYWGTVITLAFCLIDLIVYPFLRNSTIDIQIVTKWMGFVLLVTLPSNVASWILQAEGKFDKLFYVRLLNQGIFSLFVIILLFLKQLNFFNTVVAYFAGSALASLLSMMLGWTKLGHLKAFNKAARRDMFHFGKYSVGTTISAYLLKGSDTVIIRFMLGVAGPAAIADYNLPQKLMELIEIPLRSFIAVAMPLMSESVHQDDNGRVNYILTKYSGMLTIALIPVCIAGILFANVAMNLIGGSRYAHSEAANVFRIFMCYGILVPVDRFLGVTLDILNQPRLNMIKVIIMLSVNIVGDFAGILIFHNIYGVALASILTFIAGILYGYWSIKKYLKFSMIDIFVVGYNESKALANNFLLKRAKKV